MKNIQKINQNIYITSDEEIKVGDWMIRGNEQPTLVTPNFFWDFGVRYYKIILTTDQDLIKDGVQAIDNEFLEWFVKNPICESVEVDKNWNYPLDKSWEYKLRIIPKEEPKQLTDLEIAIKLEEIQREEPKQETLEEASWKFNPLKKLDGEFLRSAFVKGGNFASEQIYNQIKQLHDNEHITGFSKRAYAQCLDIIEQFKNK